MGVCPDYTTVIAPLRGSGGLHYELATIVHADDLHFDFLVLFKLLPWQERLDVFEDLYERAKVFDAYYGGFVGFTYTWHVGHLFHAGDCFCQALFVGSEDAYVAVLSYVDGDTAFRLNALDGLAALTDETTDAVCLYLDRISVRSAPPDWRVAPAVRSGPRSPA